MRDRASEIRDGDGGTTTTNPNFPKMDSFAIRKRTIATQMAMVVYSSPSLFSAFSQKRKKSFGDTTELPKRKFIIHSLLNKNNNKIFAAMWNPARFLLACSSVILASTFSLYGQQNTTQTSVCSPKCSARNSIGREQLPAQPDVVRTYCVDVILQALNG